MPQLDPFVFFDEAFTSGVFFLVFYRYFVAWFVPLVLRTRVVLWVINVRALSRSSGVASRAAALSSAMVCGFRVPLLSRAGASTMGSMRSS